MFQEKHSFTPLSGKRIFTVVYQPDKPLAQKTLIFVFSPIGEEKAWSHSQLVNSSRYLAENGITVVRFDYPGNGDSEGLFEETGMDDYLNVGKELLNHFYEKYKPQFTGIVSLRFGSLIPFMLSGGQNSIPGMNFFVLWEPVLNFYDYFYEGLRANLTSQLPIHKKVVKNRDQLIEDLVKGENIDLEGFDYTPEFYKAFKDVDIRRDLENISKPVALYYSGKLNKGAKREKLSGLFNGKNFTIDFYDDFPFWYETKLYNPNLSDLNARTFEYIKKIVKERP